jgi:hypothetical protein
MKFPPVIAPLMRDKLLSLLIIIIPLIFMLLNITGIFIWECPFHSYTGMQCGGCGITRGVIAAAEGHFYQAFLLHPFSIPLLFLWCAWCIIMLVPERRRADIVDKIEIIEQKTALSFILLTLFVLFGVARLAIQIYR